MDRLPLQRKSTFEQQIGKGKSVQWPVGVGAPGNEGVANSINTTPNAIGYVELAYATTTGMKHAADPESSRKLHTGVY